MHFMLQLQAFLHFKPLYQFTVCKKPTGTGSEFCVPLKNASLIIKGINVRPFRVQMYNHLKLTENKEFIGSISLTHKPENNLNKFKLQDQHKN